MENKYFTPDIEDFHVGYECEILKEKWEHFVFNVEEIIPVFARVNSKTIVSDKIRVPYLTKEQIEAEGWKPEKSYFRKNNLYLFFENNELEIEFGEPFTWDASDSDVRYKGECKDINTFRKIIKLLGI
jgi:hypothetical protein